jgi:hypothetical protein
MVASFVCAFFSGEYAEFSGFLRGFGKVPQTFGTPLYMLIHEMLIFMGWHCLPTALESSSLGYPLVRIAADHKWESHIAWLEPRSGDLHPNTAAIIPFNPKRN